MKKTWLIFSFGLITMMASAQQETYDIVTYMPPKGEEWKKETTNSAMVYSRIDGGSWCQIAIYKSTAGKGNVEADAQSEWEKIVLSAHTITDKDEKTTPAEADGWQVMSRSGVWQYNGANVATILTTYSNNNICISILCNATAQPYLQHFKNLIASIELSAGNTLSQQNTDHTPSQAANNTFQFNSTNFDDGWTAQAGEDWTTVSKSGIKVLVHYPNKAADQYNSDKLKGDYNSWNILVAPRYSNIQNLTEAGIQDYESITFLMADAIENSTGKKAFIVLYKKHYDKGNGRYLEVVSDSKAAFEKEFGNNYINRSSWDYHAQAKSWNKLAGMQSRNRFAVASGDLMGKWSSSTYESLTYYYITGAFTSATATATSIANEFQFNAAGNYQSDHAGASGVVGNQQFSRQVYKGNYTVSNWEMQLSKRFQGATEKYSCYFEPIKGGRILIMTDKLNTTLSLVKQDGP